MTSPNKANNIFTRLLVAGKFPFSIPWVRLTDDPCCATAERETSALASAIAVSAVRRRTIDRASGRP